MEQDARDLARLDQERASEPHALTRFEDRQSCRAPPGGIGVIGDQFQPGRFWEDGAVRADIRTAATRSPAQGQEAPPGAAAGSRSRPATPETLPTAGAVLAGALQSRDISSPLSVTGAIRNSSPRRSCGGSVSPRCTACARSPPGRGALAGPSPVIAGLAARARR